MIVGKSFPATYLELKLNLTALNKGIKDRANEKANERSKVTTAGLQQSQMEHLRDFLNVWIRT
jgi:hypothetical protein